MQVIFNDFSLNGQFEGIPEFCDSILEHILPCIAFCEWREIDVLKSYETFGCKITDRLTFQNVLYHAGSYPELLLLKSKLVQLFSNEPYWNDSSKTPEGVDANCLTEAYFRNAVLLSCKGVGYDSSLIEIEVFGERESISNASEKRQLLEGMSKAGAFSLDNSFNIPDTSLKVEVRSSEHGHK